MITVKALVLALFAFSCHYSVVHGNYAISTLMRGGCSDGTLAEITSIDFTGTGQYCAPGTDVCKNGGNGYHLHAFCGEDEAPIPKKFGIMNTGSYDCDVLKIGLELDACLPNKGSLAGVEDNYYKMSCADPNNPSFVICTDSDCNNCPTKLGPGCNPVSTPSGDAYISVTCPANVTNPYQITRVYQRSDCTGNATSVSSKYVDYCSTRVNQGCLFGADGFYYTQTCEAAPVSESPNAQLNNVISHQVDSFSCNAFKEETSTSFYPNDKCIYDVFTGSYVKATCSSRALTRITCSDKNCTQCYPDETVQGSGCVASSVDFASDLYACPGLEAPGRTGLIVGLCVGIIGGVILVIIVVVLVRSKRKRYTSFD